MAGLMSVVKVLEILAERNELKSDVAASGWRQRLPGKAEKRLPGRLDGAAADPLAPTRAAGPRFLNSYNHQSKRAFRLNRGSGVGICTDCG